MNLDILKGIILSIVLLLVQGVILNNIHLFGCATPFMLVYVMMLIPSNSPRWFPIAAGFLLGLGSDCFSNTPGVAAASMTLIGLLQPIFLKLFVNKDNSEVIYPSLNALGFAKFASYGVLLILLFTIMFFCLEHFSFANVQQILLNILGSTIITLLFIYTIEHFRKG